METKTCTKCKIEKELSFFRKTYKWYKNTCKACELEYARDYYRKRKAENRQKCSEYYKRNKDKVNDRKKKYSDKNRAGLKIQYYIRVGKIKRPSECEYCGKECKPHAHHHDYSKPLSVIFLCNDCHMRKHVEIRETKLSRQIYERINS